MIDDNSFLKSIEGDIWTDDPDDSMQSRDFYSRYWQDVLNRDIGLFRGDTILSFRTIAGCMIRLLSIYKGNFEMPESHEQRLKIINDSDEIADKLKINFNRFYEINHTFANFMPLIKIRGNYRKGSPNLQYVKCEDYHEFPDLFLKDILVYYEKGESNPKFSKDDNAKYFYYFRKLGGWGKFVELNYLQDFFEDDEFKKFVQLAPSEGVRLPYKKVIAERLSIEEKNECIKQIEVFVTNAITIIEKRAERLKNINIK